MTILNRMFGVELEGYTASNMRGTTWNHWCAVGDGSLQDDDGEECDICDSEGDVWDPEEGAYNTCTNCGGSHYVSNSGSYGVEFVSPKLTDLGEIDRIYSDLLLKKGWDVNDSCGLHVHVDATDMNVAAVARVVRLMTAVEPIMYAMEGLDRMNGSYCRVMDRETIVSILTNKMKGKHDLASAVYGDGYIDFNDVSKYMEQRYHGLNLHSYFYRGTLEFRYFEGKMNASPVKQRAELCVKLVDFAQAATDEQIEVIRKRLLDERWFEKRAAILKEVLALSSDLTCNNRRAFNVAMGNVDSIESIIAQTSVSA